MLRKKDLIAGVCRDLNISAPTISYDTSEFPTETTLAMFDPERDVLHLRRHYENELDAALAIVHELRHSWQIKTDEAFWMSGRVSSDDVTSEEYNMQRSEIDANAYAMVVLRSLGVEPLWNGLSERVKEEIKKRAREI